jgi:hypothetical protein
MYIQHFVRQVCKAASETVAKAPYHSDANVTTIQDFVARIPQAVKERKLKEIEPGVSNDPVAGLFR